MTTDRSDMAAGDGAITVLVNATAGRGRYTPALPAVIDRLGSAGLPVRVLDADTRQQAFAGCREAVDAGTAAVVAIGGDGTVHVALQAVAGRGTPLGIVPAGTGNDFAVELGLPTDPVAAAGLVAAGLAAGRVRRVDLARITGADGGEVWFGAVLGAGFDAAVNERANRMTFPRGARRYDLALLLELIRLRTRRYTLRLDGVETETDAVLVAVANTATYGGGMRICPGADPTDGMLDVLIGRRVGRATMVRLSGRVRRGTHLGHPKVTLTRARVVEIGTDGVVGYADGERTTQLPVTVTCVPGALTLLG